MFITKPKIFISSTIVDLPNERLAALKAVEKVGGLPIMSEYTMLAQNKDSLTACLDSVIESDIYILILGGRYGWQPEGKESITELEYKRALANKIPIIVFNTLYPKEPLQRELVAKVESAYFIKTVKDVFELQNEIEKSLIKEIEKKQNQLLSSTEIIYSNMVKINFPYYVFRAELNIDKKDIKDKMNEQGLKLKYRPTLFDYAVAALRLKDIRFPGDWIIWGKSILTFHDLQDSTLPLTEIIDPGTAEKLSCDEVYEISDDYMSTFKFLLKKCLETKLYKLGIKWIKEEGVYAFIPLNKDELDRWQSRKIEWSKEKKATRTVVDVKRNLKKKEEVFNLKCLAFRIRFEYLDNTWYMAIKPDWVFLWPDFSVSDPAFKNIQWLKRNERNIHVFNHFNFILHFLQPSETEFLFPEYSDYKFLKIGKIEKFEFSPRVYDENWRKLESHRVKIKLKDLSGNVDLFSS
jgi:hypothetical protein